MMLGRELARRGLRALPAVLCDLALEFGPAEALDSLLLRPALMYAGLTMIPSLALGIVFGQVAADIVFYVPTVVSYELLRRRDARRAR
ncbi:MAG: hypothetical protein ACJ8CR_03955 [Roseiflexaceae bacterium]